MKNIATFGMFASTLASGYFFVMEQGEEGWAFLVVCLLCSLLSYLVTEREAQDWWRQEWARELWVEKKVKLLAKRR